jgi:hypothetical protein
MLLFINLNAQSDTSTLTNKIKEYDEIPQEIAFLHLNKSTYLKGEQIAFTAYVLNKQSLKASQATNLYVSIKDESNNVIKEKLFLVEDGVSSNTIRVDSLFTKKNYTITAFTNWMRNFKEQNYFVEKINIIDAESNDADDSNSIIEDLDVQFLPESGHLLEGVINTVGVIAKKRDGKGLANAKVQILGNNSRVLAQFELNRFGIGKFSFIPEIGITYKAEVTHADTSTDVFKMNVPVKRKGVILSANPTQEELRLLVKTNPESSRLLKNETYSLVIHNSTLSKLYKLDFRDNNSIPFLFNLKEFSPGVNTITLFNSDNKVIAERIFFNYNNLPKTTFKSPGVKVLSDSIKIQLKTKQALDSIKVSVSVLPRRSLSDQNNHSITSYLLLQPHLRGIVEQADWYFNKIDQHKIRELDNLLITQGWSSYNWDLVFNNDLDLTYQYENLLEFEGVLNNSSEEDQEFLIHASGNRPPQKIKLPSNTESFVVNNFFHTENDKLLISRINRNRLLPANLHLQFNPNKFPEFAKNTSPVQTNSKIKYLKKLDQPLPFFDEGREILDEVVIQKKVDKVKQRERNLNINEIYGNVKVVDLEDAMLYRTLGSYLSTQPGLKVDESGTRLKVTTDLGSSLGTPSGLEGRSEGGSRTDSSMRFYLDDVPMENEFFYQYPLDLVDYVKINRRGLGGGFMEAKGSIRVYSRSGSIYENSRTLKPQKFQLPVAFSQQKKYYIPKFSNNYSDFFQNYGVIDWKPLLKSDANGNISFKIKKPKVDYQLIIQGISSNGVLIQDVQSIKLKK